MGWGNYEPNTILDFLGFFVVIILIVAVSFKFMDFLDKSDKKVVVRNENLRR